MSAASIRIPRGVLRAVRAHARREAPRECCGFLLGAAARVQFCLPMTNIARGTARYRIDPRAHIDVVRVLRRLRPGLAIIGVYHSHPKGRPMPSPRDVVEAFYPDWVHLIVGPVDGRMRVAAFRLADGRAARLTLRRT